MRKPDQPIKALAWMFLSALGFSGMNSLVKVLSTEFSQFELVFFRSFVNAVGVGFLMFRSRESFWPAGKRILIVRSLAGFISVSSLFYAIAHLPLPIATVLVATSPAFAIFFSRILIKELVPREAWGWIVLAFVGLVTVLYWGAPLRGGESWSHLSISGVAIALLSAVSAGLAYSAVRAATSRIGVNTIVFYFTAGSSLISMPAMIYKLVSRPSLPQIWAWLCLLVLGLCASVGQICMTRAYLYAPTGMVSTFGLLTPVLTSFFAFIFFHEYLTPLQWLGMGVLGFSLSRIAGAKKVQASRN